MLNKIKNKTNLFVALIVVGYIVILMYFKGTAIAKESNLNRSGTQIVIEKQ